MRCWVELILCVFEGCRSFGIDVDIELYGIDGIFVSYDTMEGLSLFYSLHFILPILPVIIINMRQSKLSLKDDASPLDGGNKSKLKLGLFSYPVLQAADVLVHRYAQWISTTSLFPFPNCIIWPNE